MIKIGDRVVCIDNSGHVNPNLIKGREYIVYAIKECRCGIVSFEIGIITEKGVICSFCSSELANVGEPAWFASRRFRKVEEKVNYVKLEIEIEEPIYN